MKMYLIGAGVMLALSACSDKPSEPPVPTPAEPMPTAYVYPDAKRVDHTDTYHGDTVADPYRWLEELDSADTRTWIDGQNAVTDKVLAALPMREKFNQRMTALWEYERYGLPRSSSGVYVFSRQAPGQNQPVLVTTTDLSAEPTVLLDANTLSTDGTQAIGSWSISPDGKLLAYAVQSGGSDWIEWRVRDIASATDLPDQIQWSKFSGASWRKDSSGFYYSAYDAPEGEDKLRAVNENQKLYFHEIGTAQSADQLVYERPDQPKWGFSGGATDDGNYLVISVSMGTDERNQVFYKDLRKADAQVVELISGFTAAYDFIGNVGSSFMFRTDADAERYRVVSIDVDGDTAARIEVVAQSDATLNGVSLVGGQLIASYLRDARSEVKRFGTDGAPLGTVQLPGLGSAGGFSGSIDDTETFYAFASYTTPAQVLRLDLKSGESSVFKGADVAFDSTQFETTQEFYTSTDGTRVPIFITARKGTARDGARPTILYAYGGFNISVTPSFSVPVATWLEMGGVYAVANIRGGGEYGRSWHEAAIKTNRPRAYEDFAAAAEYLIAQKVTSPAHLAINGRSNGGLLVAATALRRPELFAAAIPGVGVLDMLRFRDFTIGWAWESDYGSVNDEAEYRTLRSYSPLHNLKPNVEYPAMMMLTGDHDDRVFPAHTFKFTAELQHVYSGTRPMLARIETRGGHGAGKPVSMQISENADWMAFVADRTGLTP